MQFRVIVVTVPQTHKQTHRQDRLQHTAPLSVARSVNIPAQQTSFFLALPVVDSGLRLGPADREVWLGVDWAGVFS